MTHDPLASRWPAPVSSGAEDPTGYISAGPPTITRMFEQERLAAVDRECLDLDQGLVGRRRRVGCLNDLDQWV
jgi:hypothetical protein